MITKISPAFDELAAQRRKNYLYDAIVVYQAPTESRANRRQRGALQRRLQAIKERAAVLSTARSQLIEDYLSGLDAKSMISGQAEFASADIGSGSLPVVKLEVTIDTLAELENNPNVLAVMPDQPVSLVAPADIVFDRPDTSEQQSRQTWGLEALGIRELWDSTTGSGIKVAVLDTGVHGDHAMLANKVEHFAAFDPLGRRIEATPAFDAGKHGTHVCGTIAGGESPDGIAIGVAPEAKLIVGAVLLGNATLSSLINGIDWAVKSGADIISLSLGFKVFEPLFDTVLGQLIDDYDILPVAAIGNESHGNTSSPGSSRNALAVGAIANGGSGFERLS